MYKEYITVAEWRSHNEIDFAICGKHLCGKTPQYCESRVKQLFEIKYIAELHLRGWHIQIRTNFADNDPMCDWVDVQITFLHNDKEVTALETEYIHKMLNTTPIKIRQATDMRSPRQSLVEIT